MKEKKNSEEFLRDSLNNEKDSEKLAKSTELNSNRLNMV